MTEPQFNPYQITSSLSSAEAEQLGRNPEVAAVAKRFIEAIPIFMHFQKRYEFVYGYQMMVDQNRNPFGNFILLREPVTASSQKDVMPNTDTLYGVTFLDLAVQGPLVIWVPKISSRFWSLQFVDNAFYNYDYVSRRTDGDGDGNFLVVPPNWRGNTPDGIKRIIQAPATSTQIYQRLYFNNATDLPAAHKLQDAISITRLNDFLGKSAVQQSVDIKSILAKPPTVTTAREFFATSVEYCGQVDQTRQDSDAVLADGVALARYQLAAYVALESKRRDAWQALESTVGRRDQSTPVAHAVTQIRSMAANDVKEAIYFLTQSDALHSPLLGKKSYSLTFTKKALPPVHDGGFWSVTLYDAHNFMLVENEVHKYAIRSKDALYVDDDSHLTIYLQREKPSNDKLVPNWLPTAGHDFVLMIRLYVPAEQVIAGKYLPPALRKQ